jgi:hypothetical protein
MNAQKNDIQANTIHGLLDTRNKQEQVERIRHLLAAAQAPVVDLVIRFDGRLGQVVDVNTVGGRVGFEESLAILEQARALLMARAAQAVKVEERSDTIPARGDN